MKRFAILLLCLALFAALPACAEVLPGKAFDEGWLEFTGMYARNAVVLCESLTVRQEPSFTSDAIDSLAAGDTFLTDQDQDGWLHIFYADGAKEGWVRSEYVLECPDYLILDRETPAFAYGDAAAPRVGLLAAETRLPIIYMDENWYVVSLRGASAWIQRSAENN